MIPIDRETALEKLLATSTFAGAARSQALLRFLAQRAWFDGDAAVNEVVIALDHLGRDARTFDPKTDSVVRVELSRLRKRLDTCFAGELADAPWRITLPSGSYAPQFARREVTLPPVLPSPAVSGEPMAQVAPLIREPQISPSVRPWQRVPRVAWAIAGAAALAVSGWALWQSGSSHVDPGDVVAVMPFTCAIDAAEDLFCDGLADEVLDKLVRVPELKVIARTSSFKFKGKPIDAREAGKLLGAKYLVEGSLQREGDSYKLVAQMVRTGDGAHVVSRVFQRTSSERLRLQSDLAGLVADALTGNLRPAFANAKSDREQLSADALLKWRRVMKISPATSKVSQDESLALVDDILLMHPAFARGWAEKADLLRNRHYFGETLEVAVANAITPMRKAVELDPDDPGIQANFLFLEFLNGVDVRTVHARMKTLAERNPNHGVVLYWWATILWLTGRLQQAADAFQVCQVLAPLSAPTLHMRSRMLLAMGDKDHLDEALLVVDKAIAMAPNFMDLYRVRGQILIAQGSYAAGKAEVLRGIAERGPMANELEALNMSFKESRTAEKAATGAAVAPVDIVAQRFAIVAKYGPSTMPLAAISALASGHREEAIGWAQKSVSGGSANAALLSVLHDSAFLSIRDDPRMQVVYDRIGSSWANSTVRPGVRSTALR